MDWKDIAGDIAKVAPMVGTLLAPVTGGASVAVGGLISMIGSAFGLSKEEVTPDKISAIIQQDPQALLKFKELEMNNHIELEKLLLQKDQMYLADVQSARQRQIESERVTGKKDNNLYALAWTYIGGYFITMITITALAFSESVPIDMPGYMVFLLGNLFGTLTTGTVAIIQYFFGSSKGSSEKTNTMVTQFQDALKTKNNGK